MMPFKSRRDTILSKIGVDDLLEGGCCTWSGWVRRKTKINRALGTVLNIPWRQNFAVLVNGIMHLYVNELAKRPRKYLPLSKYNGVVRAYNIKDNPWCFYMVPLTTKDRPQLFRCSTEAELKDCMGHIREEILNAHRKPSEFQDAYNGVDYFVLEKPILNDVYIDIMEQDEDYCVDPENGRHSVSADCTDEEDDPDTDGSGNSKPATYQNISLGGRSLSHASSHSSSAAISRGGSAKSRQSITDSMDDRFSEISLYDSNRTSTASDSSVATSDGPAICPRNVMSSPPVFNDEDSQENFHDKFWDSLPQLPSRRDKRSGKVWDPLPPLPASTPDSPTTIVLEDLDTSSSVSSPPASPDLQCQQVDIAEPDAAKRYSNLVFTSIYHFVDTNDKQVVIRILTASSIEGSYLVRKSRTSPDLVLSVYIHGVKEYHIQRTDGRRWYLSKDAVFRSLEDLLRFYSDNPLPNRDLKLRADISTL